ncbi:MAG: anaerobic ribonucleoside triphosphate reductase [Clostridia bacterium]|nr:anaerobic ribonucleoside triphosphate reductase [Clostridia bacterium]
MGSAPQTILKRDGTAVPFDAEKIRLAMEKACLATPEEQVSAQALIDMTALVVARIQEGTTPSVEQVQDLVEQVLIEAGYGLTAKAYILYRAEHAKIRRSEEDLMNIYRELTYSYAQNADLKRENANIDADTAMGTMLKYGSEGAKYFVDQYVLPKDVAAGHINGDIHIHDKDFYMLTETCCQIDLMKLFKNGFSTGHGILREPNGIASYSALGCIALQANQNEMHGGQSIPTFDYAMAEGVAKSFRSLYRSALVAYFQIGFALDETDSEALADKVGQSIGWPSMSALDEYEGALSGVLAAYEPEQAKAAHEYASRTALKNVKRNTYQAMEALIHNLNTMNSRAGAQVPFSSVNYGTDTSPEGRLVIESLLLATEAGLGNGETAIFPVQIFKVKQGINYDPGDPNYDLFRLALRVSAKRLFPNFSFLDAPFNDAYYKPGDPDSEVAYMGCRTRVMGNVYDRSREVTSGRGNLSFTSINLPRLGLICRGDWDLFYRMLTERMELCFRQLLHRYSVQCTKRVRNYPFLMGQGIWLDSEKLGPDDTVGEVLKHGTLSVGFIGLAETLVAMTGSHHGQNEESQRRGLEIVSFMRRMTDEQSARTGLNFTLLATPAEGLSGRFVAIDRDRFGEIEGITDRAYYTNSFHVPVYYQIGAYKKIRTEAPYHALTNAGHISYVELDGDTSKNLEAFESIIRCMKEAGIGYGSVNHPVDRDPVCGYTGVIDDVCPRCGRREGEAIDVETLRALRRQYPNMPMFYGLE